MSAPENQTALKRITFEQAEAAEKLLKRYGEQCADEAHARFTEQRERINALIADLGGNPKLGEWAEAKRQAQLVRGIGLKSDPAGNREWLLKGLKNSLIDVCQAFDVPVETFLAARKTGGDA
jgi:DNA-binding GntR family transcriptional regulator